MPALERSGTERRGTYFAFQGLLMAVLILLFVYLHAATADWAPRFSVLAAVMGASLVFLQTAPAEVLADRRAQVALFLGDAGLAWLVLYWTGAQAHLFLIYAIILFGSALMRDLRQSFLVALITSALYVATAWPTVLEEGFWLRIIFLWVLTSLLAILSRDSESALAEAEKKYRERITQLERLATLGQVAGEIAHRIKGPLTTILVNAEVLSHRHGRSLGIGRELDQIQAEVGHCKDILKSLLDLGRIEELALAPIDLRDPVRSALKSVEPQLAHRRLALEVSGLDAPAPVRGDRPLLHEAVAAVLQNAIDAAVPEGRLRLRLEARFPPRWWGRLSGAREEFAIIIEDDGKGIDPRDLEQIFQPFFSTKGKEGTGLGLSASLRILQKHGGTIEAHSRGPGSGSSFVFLLPARAAGGRPRGKRRR